MPVSTWALAALLAAPCPPANRPVLAEVFYDAAGDDTGHEFVEIFNPGAAGMPLAGLRLEAGDGAGPERWTLRWTGGGADTIRAGGRFVIGGALVTPAPEALVTLAIQNGPDAIRLVWPDGFAETLGFGELEHGEYFCGAPAPDAAAGLALARVPDDAGAGSNALDFRAQAPSPGRANQPGRDVQVEPGSLALAPERPEPGSTARITATIRNAGREALDAGSVTLVAQAAGLEARAGLGALGPGEAAEAGVDLGPLPAGKHAVRLGAVLAGDEAPANDADSLLVRVGAGPLRLREIQYHPAGGEGEWVELANAGDAALDPAGYRIADRSGTTGAPQGGTGEVPAESLVVFAQRRADLLARFPALEPARVWEVQPWPALNNGNDASGTADEVRVIEPDGTPSDVFAYSANGVPDGTPLEHRGGAWWPSLAAAGTPLAPPVLPAPIAGSFALAGRRLARPGAPARIVWDLPWPAGYATLAVHDLAGRRVLRPFIDLPVPARGERPLDTAALPPGLYVVAFEVRPAGAGEPLVARQPLRIDGAGP
jgi:hypothetical protein